MTAVHERSILSKSIDSLRNLSKKERKIEASKPLYLDRYE